MRILVAGASGYIGSRLVPRLLDAGHEVRCLVRRGAGLDGLPWGGRVALAVGDIGDGPALSAALDGCETACLLDGDGGGPLESRRRVEGVREAATAAGLRRVVCLTSLPLSGPGTAAGTGAPPDGRTPVTVLHAPVVIGSGSPLFEMLRYLTEVVPVIATPRWTRRPCRPMAVADLLGLAVQAVEDPGPGDRMLQAGGPDVATYQDLLRAYAREMGLRRGFLPLPGDFARLSAWWIGLVTPVPAAVARSIVQTLATDDLLRDDVGDVFAFRPTPMREALQRAAHTPPEEATYPGSPAAVAPDDPVPGDPEWSGGRVYVDRQVVPTDAEPRHVYWAFSRIGGDVGYYGMNWAWKLRGWLDRLLGGGGLRRGRRHPEHLSQGEAVDFWRVDQISPGRLLRLRAELRLPGEAFLQWEIDPVEGGSDLIQTAIFRPRGLLGRAYWFLMKPVHSYIFPRMAWKMAAAAEERGYACP